ncbi:MAG: hypothetical protein KBD44_01915 [Candidatus Pacebacteria bacterium]|nr:hypothetical protein [Candidatus Paceibacterota bacterium]
MPTKTKSLVVAKKATTKSKSAATDIVCVSAEFAFWTIDGVVYHSLSELADGLSAMEGRVYRYHADKDHQDFAAWVSSVFMKKPLATLLKKATTAKAAEKVIRTHLKASK